MANYRIEEADIIAKYQLTYIESWSLEQQNKELIAGIFLRPTDDIQALIKIVHQIPLVLINCANFDDGRGYSQIRLLKQVNYTGEIKVVNVHLDHLQFLERIGIDSYELVPEDCKYDLSYATDFTVCYQVAENNNGLVEKHKLIKVLS